MRLVVGKPVRENLVLMRIAGIDDRIKSGIEIRERLDVFAVDTLDPLTILLRVPDIANTDGQRKFILKT